MKSLVNTLCMWETERTTSSKHRLSPRNDALSVAHALSVQFPNFTITVEEWRFVFSSEFLDSGLFMGEVITFPALNRKEVA